MERHGASGAGVPTQGAKTARFAIVPQLTSSPAPAPYAPDLDQRIERAGQALRARLHWTAENLPRISTDDKLLDDLYYRSILSVVDSRWERENFAVRPFYAVGTWLFTIAWDTSYASELLAMLDPAGLRDAFLNFVRSGLLTCTYIPWNGKAGEFAYAQDPFAKMRIFQDYLRQTGDMAFLDRVENGASVYEWMKRTAVELRQKRARPDGLLDFGSNSNNLLEMRTDGYEHVVAAMNALAGDYFRQPAEWGRARNDPDAEQLAHSTLAAIMGRTAAYTGRAVKWDEMMDSNERLGPTEYAMGPVPIKAEVPVPGNASNVARNARP